MNKLNKYRRRSGQVGAHHHASTGHLPSQVEALVKWRGRGREGASIGNLSSQVVGEGVKVD